MNAFKFKKMKFKHTSIISLQIILGMILISIHVQAVPHGYLNVTTVGADPSGQTDSTAALQNAINQARDENLVVWLPAGTYRISDRLEADQPDNNSRFPTVIIGSTVDPDHRATIYLAPSSSGFNDPENRRVMLHYFNRGTADRDEGPTDLYNQALVSVNFKVGPNNDGAIAVRMQGAEGCTIQDVHIDLSEGGHTGILGVPGSGGSTHGVTVIGGRIGIDTRRPPALAPGGSQPTPVITGARLIGQSDVALFSTSRGALVLVGSHIVRDTPGPAIRLWHNWAGQPFDGSLQLVDCQIEYTQSSPQNTVVAMQGEVGRSFHFDDTYIRNASEVWTGIASNPEGWRHFKHVAIHIQPVSRPWGQPMESIYMDGEVYGDIYVNSTDGSSPEEGFLDRHRIPDNFPSWESPGVVDVTDLGAIGDGKTDNHAILQAAIDRHETLFFPKGTFMVSDTLELRPISKLIGAHHMFSIIQAISEPGNRFAGTTEEDTDQPIIRSADVANAQTWLGFLQIKRTFALSNHNPTPVGNFALEWRSGGESIVRMVKVESNPTRNFRPDFAATNFYGIDIINHPIDSFHPQQSFPDGMWAWPCNHPNVVIRGNGGGRWYNFWFHGRQALRENVPFLLIEGTSEPLHIYHLHMQQQDSRNHGEVRDSANVSIYGTKGELKGTLVYFENSNNVRLYGNGGLTSPNANYFDPHLFRFINCDNFLIGGLGDTINEGESYWIGGAFDRWIHANIETWFPIEDASNSRENVSVPFSHRPILYLRGATQNVPFSEYQRPAAPEPWQAATDLGNDIFQIPWFGQFQIHQGSFINHHEHGFLYTPSHGTDSLWLWQPALGWIWTSSDVYPFLWHHTDNKWLYYAQGGQPDSRNFFDYHPEVNAWFSL